MELFFNDQAMPHLQYLEFDQFESQHILKAMRKRLGEKIFFTDGRGGLYQGELLKLKPFAKTTCELIEQSEAPAEIHSLACGFIKHNRLDFMIEKATELGINRFYLFYSDFANYFSENTSHVQKIARQAIKQSNRFFLPEIHVFDNFNTVLDFLEKCQNKYIALQDAQNQLQDYLQEIKQCSDTETVIVIGPEGGFSENEMKVIKETSFRPVLLGLARLRTETAAIVAASVLNFCRI